MLRSKKYTYIYIYTVFISPDLYVFIGSHGCCFFLARALLGHVPGFRALAEEASQRKSSRDDLEPLPYYSYREGRCKNSLLSSFFGHLDTREVLESLKRLGCPRSVCCCRIGWVRDSRRHDQVLLFGGGVFSLIEENGFPE